MYTPNAWLTITSEPPYDLLINQKRADSKRSNQSTMNLLFGHSNQPTQVVLKSKQYHTAQGSFPIRIKREGSSYKIGPTVGIMTIEGNQGFKGNKKNYIDIIKMGMKAGILVYVFTAESINEYDKTVEAYLFLPNSKRWVTRKMPLPDVIYNRIPYRNDENKYYVQSAISFLKSQGIPFFNPFFFNKWTLYKWLKSSEELTKILPDTAPFSEWNLEEFLNKYKTIYLKPVHGKAGVGFIKISKERGLYSLNYQSAKITYNQQYHRFIDLLRKVTILTRDKEYIMQYAIPLDTYQGNPYDIRVLVQKDGVGEWNVSGIGVRVAGSKSITTHVPRGGYIENINRVLANRFGDNYVELIKDSITKKAIKIAKYIETQSKHDLGELSMDLGLEKNGRIWFFEANSKPMEFDEPQIRYTSLKRLAQYFIYLSKFKSKMEV